MTYSIRQKLFADFMLKKIGITDTKDIDIYLSHLEKLYGRMVSYPNESNYGGIGWYYSVSGCIEQIKEEVDLKQAKQEVKLVKTKPTFTATDLANYDYCPASFVISNSFLIENRSGMEFTETGKQLHEQLLASRTTWQEDDAVYSSSGIDAKIVRESRLVFAGHQDENKKFANGNWIGVPDYIFQDSEDKFFVVEEKFHKKKDPQKMSSSERMDEAYGGSGIDEVADKERKEWSEHKGYFFSNHIVQLVSYLKNIKEYSISYGYLLYWYYDFDRNNEPYIHKVVAKKVDLNEETEKLYSQSVKGIEELKALKQITFPVDKLNMKKCAGCVVNKYCGHKTRRFSKLIFPYEHHYLNLYYAIFPEELKKTTP